MLGGELHEARETLAVGVVAKDMELSDSLVDATPDLLLDHGQDGRVLEPGERIGRHDVGAREGDGAELGWCRREKLARAVVGAAGEEDAANASAPPKLEHG